MLSKQIAQALASCPWVKLVAALYLITCSSKAFCEQFSVLLFTKTSGFHHTSINAGVDALERLAEQHYFKLEWHEDAKYFNDDYLSNIDVVVFLSTSGDILNEAQQEAFKRYIRSGKGFVGVHCAACTERDWPWYGKLIGHYFKIHPKVQTAQISNLDPSFPGMKAFDTQQLWTDEWYEFYPANVPGLNYLMSVDERSYSTYAKWETLSGNGMGEFHPIAWYHYFDGGRSFYTGLGHLPTTFENEQFLRHLYGAIYWAATGKGITESKH